MDFGAFLDERKEGTEAETEGYLEDGCATERGTMEGAISILVIDPRMSDGNTKEQRQGQIGGDREGGEGRGGRTHGACLFHKQEATIIEFRVSSGVVEPIFLSLR